MKKIYQIAITIFCISICARNIYAQESQVDKEYQELKEKKREEMQLIENELIKAFPKKVRYLRTYRHIYFGSARITAEHTIILFKGTTYYFLGEYEKDCHKDKIVFFSLFSQEREELFTNAVTVIGKKGKKMNNFKGICFRCNATGIYYLTLHYPYCSASVVIGVVK